MKHERIVVEAQEMPSVGCLFQSKKRIEVAGTCSGCDPFGHCASWQVALDKLAQADEEGEWFTSIVVDIRRPSRSDLHPGVSVGSNGRNERPVFVHRIQQDRTSIIPDNVCNATIVPSLKSIPIV